MLDVLTVGLAPDLVPFTEGWALQRRIHREVVAGERPDTLLLLEHEAVYTAGVRTRAEDLPTDGAEVVRVDRGGRITWHGPGQLVGYPILRLPEPLDVVAHVRRLEDALIAALARHGVPARRRVGHSGVWADRDDCHEKIAAIGVRVEQGVTMHGFALNGDNDLEGFARIVPCGITDGTVTTATRLAGRRITPAQLHDDVAAACRTALASERVAA